MKNFKYFPAILLMILIVGFAIPLQAEMSKTLYVITDIESPIIQLSPVEVKRIFLGTQRTVRDIEMIPFVLPPTTADTQAFNRYILKKSPGELESYWIAERLSGGAREPSTLKSYDEFQKTSRFLKEQIISYTFGPINPVTTKVLLQISVK